MLPPLRGANGKDRIHRKPAFENLTPYRGSTGSLSCWFCVSSGEEQGAKNRAQRRNATGCRCYVFCYRFPHGRADATTKGPRESWRYIQAVYTAYADFSIACKCPEVVFAQEVPANAASVYMIRILSILYSQESLNLRAWTAGDRGNVVC